MITNDKKIKICKSCKQIVCKCGKKDYVERTYKINKEK